MRTTAVFGVVLGTAALLAYTPGIIYYGTSNYVQYRNGNLPIIISIPHDGTLTPATIATRTAAKCGAADFYTGPDRNTLPLTIEIRKALFAETGKYPHVVQLNLSRSKLDPNRDSSRGACGDPIAERTWTEYHSFIDQAIEEAKASYGHALYIDLHGHGHTIQRVEVGFNISGTDLRQDDVKLNSYEESSSIFEHSVVAPSSFAGLVRGPTSFGSLLAKYGYRAVPSTFDPYPNVGEGYTYGGSQGYSITRHGGIMLEHNYSQLRDTAANRQKYAVAFVKVVREYLRENLSVEF